MMSLVAGDGDEEEGEGEGGDEDVLAGGMDDLLVDGFEEGESGPSSLFFCRWRGLFAFDRRRDTHILVGVIPSMCYRQVWHNVWLLSYTRIGLLRDQSFGTVLTG